jgi:transglutaminase-like putative cysteine protease
MCEACNVWAGDRDRRIMRTVNRREFLQLAAAPLLAQATSTDGWRTFEITTRVQILKPSGPTRVWLPMPLAVATYQKTLGDTYHAQGGKAVVAENDDLDILVAEWDEGVEPILIVTNRVSTADRTANLTTPTVPPPLDARALDRFLRPTKLLPTDGIVKSTANMITRGAGTDFERARAIYEWIVDNTFRDPATRGCGTGDIRFMLESKNLSGKCADLNALFVGLARASGIPARDVWGIRVAKSQTDLHSLGLSSDNATNAHHCRAEAYLTGYGWVPVDPADVRKVALEEPPGHLAMDDEKVRSARARLFGSWEMNWIAFNYAHDVTLPRSRRGPLGFFMYPQAETANGRLDSLDPDNFKYEIYTREV